MDQVTKDLFVACEYGNFANVQYAIDNGADVNAKNDYGTTPLMIASAKARPKIVGTRLIGASAIVDILIKANADVNEADDGGFTPVMIAAGKGKAEIIDTLFKAHANLNAKSKKYSKTALMFAAYWGHKEAVIKLIELGADVNETDKMGENALDLTTDEEIKELLRSEMKKQKIKEATADLMTADLIREETREEKGAKIQTVSPKER